MIIRAHGHENVLSLHRNTVEVTCDEHLTTRGDCILAVGADRMPEAMEGDILIRFSSEGITDEIKAKANPSFTNRHEMVIRKTDFSDARTFATHADKAAKDMDRKLVSIMTDSRQTLIVEITRI